MPNTKEERRLERVRARKEKRKMERGSTIVYTYAPTGKGGSTIVYTDAPTEEIIQERKRALRVYCIYFPQFHSFQENDTNFYPGFTDIVNLDLMTKEKPSSKYLTPSLKELGLRQMTDYDLEKNEGIIQRQIDILANYNLEGFAIYYYWFSVNSVSGNNMLMSNVIDRFFDSSIDMKQRKVYFIWANEDWTSNVWFGDKPGKIENTYDEISLQRNIDNMMKYFLHDNYLKIGNKPVLFLYHPQFLTSEEIQRFVSLLQTACVNQGFSGIELCFNGTRSTYSEYSNFYSMANEPNSFMDYKIRVENGTFKHRMTIANFDFDNSPRMYKPRRENLRVYHNVTEELQEMFLRNIVHMYTHSQPTSEVENILLVNAWNEWGEKMAVEPSEEKGYYFLDMIQRLIS